MTKEKLIELRDQLLQKNEEGQYQQLQPIFFIISETNGKTEISDIDPDFSTDKSRRHSYEALKLTLEFMPLSGYKVLGLVQGCSVMASKFDKDDYTEEELKMIEETYSAEEDVLAKTGYIVSYEEEGTTYSLLSVLNDEQTEFELEDFIIEDFDSSENKDNFTFILNQTKENG